MNPPQPQKFESAYKPKTLRNWEVPKRCTLTPINRTGSTKIIANERGRFLVPEIKRVKRKPLLNLPKKIDADTAQILNNTFSENSKNKNEVIKNQQEYSSNIEDQEKNEIVPYVPGDLTEEKDRLNSHTQLAQNRFNANQRKPSSGYPKYRDDFSRISPLPEPSLSEQVQDVIDNTEVMVGTQCEKENDLQKNKFFTPILNAISNFNLAKKLHKENLEHNPLPDTITDSIYRKLQMQRKQNCDPGLMLDDKNFACGVGWKGYPGYGPTKCTKLKVYRPKTCAHHNIKQMYDEDRPSTANSFDKKWRFIKQNKVKPIDLALCWDLSPADPEDEPKLPLHIDGSNGSQAPAVFSLVHTPKDECENVPKCDGVHACGPIFEHGGKGGQAKDFIFDRPRTSLVPKSSGTRSGTSEEGKKRAKSAHDLHHEYQEKSSCSASEKSTKSSAPSLKDKAKGFHRSTPNLRGTEKHVLHPCDQHSCKKIGKRLCVACELKKLPGDRKLNTEYKTAFKAGVPQKYNYKRDDYPEHWRLATVYQHSYKPINLRKRNLLQTVYK
ncbi:uncharacterized protein LOC115886077 isoform X2 [Sitophilus oryzae]|uniref:Cilia- and flagella-associated protein 126 n=1 Tax=Sitophilus oryzae TaxID=7048 RepID=A0A6J2YCR9_SITOR|nr:uncharacterized protein LOC115886077 isoform X2 [Sitophilus oryzae]